jgi:putative OPT family oligopeptide transporter
MAKSKKQVVMTTQEPLIPASESLPEITLKVLVLGFFLTIILAAANAYLGLKVGATVSASIPAAVISMAILRFFRNSNVLENTMVQIMASVGEALTAGIAFVLPALIILHIWDHFDYWQTVAAGLIGGSLGVLFTIPLRRALLSDRSLRYPEAVAISNVLRASATKDGADFKSLIVGGLAGSVIALCQTGFQILRDGVGFWFKGPTFIYGFGLGFSPALLAAGYICGINVALSVLLGILIGWTIGVPALSFLYGIPVAATMNDATNIIWATQIRYIGVGTMLIGGLWTMCTLFSPVITSITSSFATLRDIRLGKKAKSIRTERDIPINYVFIGAAIFLVPIFLLLAYSIIPANLNISNQFRFFIAGFGTVYILIGGFIFSAIAAYFAGLIGSSNNPLSGLMVSSLLILSLMLLGIFALLHSGDWTQGLEQAVGVVVSVGSVVIIGAAGAISNDTMQDLKVGQTMGATPWKQQLMLLLGVLITAFVVAPILQLLYQAYGIGGVFPRPGMNPAQMLAAPQAGLMATVANGVFTHNLQWPLIGTGAVVAAFCIFIDEYLKRNYNARLPVLAVGLGIYLPADTSVPLVIGGLLAYLIERKLSQIYKKRSDSEQERKLSSHRHRGLLLACGMVAGASLMGVILAIPFALKQSSDALKIMPDSWTQWSGISSIVVTALLCIWIYRLVLKRE